MRTKRAKRKQGRQAAKLIQAAIDKLMAESGGTSAGIAAYLERQGVQGLQYKSTYCPVAQFVKRETGLQVTTGCNDTQAWDDLSPAHVSYLPLATVLHPKAVHDFVLDFDRTKYPNLLWRGKSSQSLLT